MSGKYVRIRVILDWTVQFSGSSVLIVLPTYPAHGDMHDAFFSSISTLYPALAAVFATVEPAGPAPTTIRS
jgi:hypothetical protein